MTIICYHEHGKAISDFSLEEEMEIIWDSITFCPKEILYYSTENIFTRIRLEIVNNEMDCNDVVFRYNDIDFPINRFGAIVDWPSGFCDIVLDMSEKIMRSALAKRKLEKENE